MIKKKKARIIIKIVLSVIYLLVAATLVYVSYRMFVDDNKDYRWRDVDSTKRYAYIKISQMSEAFAKVKGGNKQFHFVIEKEKNGNWHTYIIAISKKDLEKYQKLIDYTYEISDEKVEDIKVYGYPRKIKKAMKKLAIKNISNFVPVENEVVLTNDNFDKYLTNTYLDTTVPKSHETNYMIVTLLTMALILIILIIYTICDRVKLVDDVENVVSKENDTIEE